MNNARNKKYNESLANENSYVFSCSLQRRYTLILPRRKQTNLLQCNTQPNLILLRLQLPWHFLCDESMIVASIVVVNHHKNMTCLCFYAEIKRATMFVV